MSTGGLRLKFAPSHPQRHPFNFAQQLPPLPLPSPSATDDGDLQLPAPPTSWLPQKDMNVYGSEPLREDVGNLKCADCGKVVLKSVMNEHLDTCKKIKAGLLPAGVPTKKAGKTVDFVDVAGSGGKKGKKRKADEGPDELGDDGQPKKKAKTTGKGRVKGPVNLDSQCGVINDKGLPCSRALKCKTHSMGAKRAVEGRSKSYDELLLDFNRMHDPNFVEPVKRETKAEKAAAKQREREEKKRLAMEAKAAAGPATTKKSKPAASKANADVGVNAKFEEPDEDFDALDSEAEVESLAAAVRNAMRRGVVAVPLAVPAEEGTWFVQRRESYRTSVDLLAQAFQMKPRIATATFA